MLETFEQDLLRLESKNLKRSSIIIRQPKQPIKPTETVEKAVNRADNAIAHFLNMGMKGIKVDWKSHAQNKSNEELDSVRTNEML